MTKQSHAYKVGLRIAAAMKAKGMDADGLAKALRVDRTSVFRWLRGESVPRPARMVAISRVLGQNPSVLMYGAGAVDLAALRTCIEIAERVARRHGLKPSVADISAIALQAYASRVDLGITDPDELESQAETTLSLFPAH